MTLAETFESLGYVVVRSWTRDSGQPALLLQPPSLPVDMAKVELVVSDAGDTFAEGYPQWMALRKLVSVTTTA